MVVYEHTLGRQREAYQTVEAVELLINMFPRSVTEANNIGHTPVHLACPLQVVRFLVERGPRLSESTYTKVDNKKDNVLKFV
jgi:ankyrin repeat protein